MVEEEEQVVVEEAVVAVAEEEEEDEATTTVTKMPMLPIVPIGTGTTIAAERIRARWTILVTEGDPLRTSHPNKC